MVARPLEIHVESKLSTGNLRSQEKATRMSEDNKQPRKLSYISLRQPTVQSTSLALAPFITHEQQPQCPSSSSHRPVKVPAYRRSDSRPCLSQGTTSEAVLRFVGVIGVPPALVVAAFGGHTGLGESRRAWLRFWVQRLMLVCMLTSLNSPRSK